MNRTSTPKHGTQRITDPDEIVSTNNDAKPNPPRDTGATVSESDRKANELKKKNADTPEGFTAEQQNAYAQAQASAPQRNVKPYDDIHDWYRRTNGGQKVDA